MVNPIIFPVGIPIESWVDPPFPTNLRRQTVLKLTAPAKPSTARGTANSSWVLPEQVEETPKHMHTTTHV